MSLSLVPAPKSVSEQPGQHFELTSSAELSGPLAEVLAAELELRTGNRPEVSAAGSLRLSLAEALESEEYRLEITPAGVQLSGGSPAGLRYGIATFIQLLSSVESIWRAPAVAITDAPRFGYRGFMLDVARRFFDVSQVKQIISRISRLKFNVLHLHLSDDQGWRVELPSFPELTEVASGTGALGGAAGFFTVSDIAELVAFAQEHGITVVPEIDLPGHTHAVGIAYPDLVEHPKLSAEMLDVIEQYGGGVPELGKPYQGIAVGFSSLRIRHEPTYEFIAGVLRDLAGLFPGPWMHVGGDECLGTDPADFNYFMQRVTGLVEDLGRTPLTWHEAGSAEELASSTIGQYWGLRAADQETSTKAARFAARGGLLLSPGDATYLDMKYDASTPMGLTWADGPTSVHRSYDWEPGQLFPGLDDAVILGVEAPIWTETIGSLSDLDFMAYPRIAAAAEIAWSPRPPHPRRTWEHFRQRVSGLGDLWRSQGIEFYESPEVWSVPRP